MTIEAVRLSKERGHRFPVVFSNQWVLSEDSPGPLPKYTPHQLGKWTLHAGPELDVAVAVDPERDISVAFLGQGVDRHGDFVTDAVLKAHLSTASDPAALANELTMIGGRYLFIIVAPDFRRLYLDPSGCMGAVYDPIERLVAATLFMALARPLEPEKDFPFGDIAETGSGGRFAFGVTPDARVRRLLCNHYLDLRYFTVHRHWPHPDDDLTCPMTMDAIEERVDVVISRHRQILDALTKARPTLLPVSGGNDSRLLLGLSKGILDQYLMFFVHRHNRVGRFDVKVAKQVAKAIGVELAVLDAVNDRSFDRPLRFGRRMNDRKRLATGILEGGPDENPREIVVRQVLPQGASLLRGNVTDVSKAVLWGNPGIREFLQTNGTHHDPAVGIKMMRLGSQNAASDPWCLDAYKAWQESIPASAAARILDFTSLEHFRSHGQGAGFYAATNNFYQTPSCDRTILQALISIPPHLRAYFHVNDLILDMTAPELIGVPYGGDIHNKVRANRMSLEDYLRKGPSQL